MGDHWNSDVAARADFLRETALQQEAEAASLYRLALDCGRWGLCQAEDDTRHHSRALTIAALLNRARAAALLEQAMQVPRLTS